MRVAILNAGLVARDAIGRCIIEQVRLFRSRGDDVRVFVEHPADDVPADVLASTEHMDLRTLRRQGGGWLAGADLVVFHFPGYYSLLEAIHDLDGGCVVVDYHGITPPDLWRDEVERATALRSIERSSLLQEADLVVVHSEFMADELRRRFDIPEGRLLRIPLFADLTEFSPARPAQDVRARWGIDAQAPILLFVGRMAPNKRIDVLIAGLAAVRQQGSGRLRDAQLVLVGDDRTSPALRAEVERARDVATSLEVATAVHFTGRIDALPDAYRTADLFVVASQHEGFCVPVLEAMASGVAVVASDFGALPETAGGAAIHFGRTPSGEPDAAAFAARVVELLEPAGAPRRAQLVRDGAARASSFGIQPFQRAWADLADRATASGPLRAQIEEPGHTALERRSPPHSAPRRVTPLPRPPQLVDDEPYPVPSHRPVIGPVINALRRWVGGHLRHFYVDPMLDRQDSFNRRLARSIDDLTRVAEDLRDRLDGDERRILTQIARVDAALARAETLAASLREQPPPGSATTRSQGSERPAPSSDLDRGDSAALAEYGINYLRLNRSVGGSLDDEMALYARFVDLFRGASLPVLDLGCGRGAFLRLLAAARIPARGIDVDPWLVDLATEEGLPVERADALAFLESLPDSSLGGLFCAHVVEHLPRTRLARLAELCRDKVTPGAAVVWITPNGAGLTALHTTFWKDLTHSRPLHPAAIEFLFESAGLRVEESSTCSPLAGESRLPRLSPGRVETPSAPSLGATPPTPLEVAVDRIAERLNEVVFGDVDCVVVGRR